MARPFNNSPEMSPRLFNPSPGFAPPAWNLVAGLPVRVVAHSSLESGKEKTPVAVKGAPGWLGHCPLTESRLAPLRATGAIWSEVNGMQELFLLIVVNISANFGQGNKDGQGRKQSQRAR